MSDIRSSVFKGFIHGCTAVGVVGLFNLAITEALRKEAREREEKALEREEARHKETREREEARHKETLAREEASQNEVRMKEATDRYDQIRKLESLAREVCKKATRSSCTEAQDYIRFAEVYGRSRAIVRSYLSPAWFGVLRADDLQKVDAFREAFNAYYCKVYPFQIKAAQPRSRPGMGEFESFLTFHWSVNMANTICAEKKELWDRYKALQNPHVYDLALLALQARDTKAHDRVTAIQADVRKQLLPIRSRIFHGKEDNTGLRTPMQ